MNKEFIPYNQALALKELGFDEPCFGYYQKSAVIGDGFPLEDMEGKPCNALDYKWQNSKIHFTNITAPLYQQAFRWFREKYWLDNAVLKDRYVIETREDLPSWWYYGLNTYEEAELACLIKLIEIVKNK